MLEQRIQQRFFDSADLQYRSAEVLLRPIADATADLGTPEEIRRAIRLSAEELKKELKAPSGSPPQEDRGSGLINGTHDPSGVR